jgi:Mn-containing catalase
MLTIEHPLTGEKRQIANKDFAEQMSWESAIEACEKLGSGWRLPTIEELEAMYEELHKKGQGNFSDSDDSDYWSSTVKNPTENDGRGAYYVTFSDGGTYCASMYHKHYVRAVRAL